MESGIATELPQNPRERANPLSFLLFCWTMPVFFKGRKKELDTSDLYRALKTHRSDNGHFKTSIPDPKGIHLSNLIEYSERQANYKMYEDFLKETLGDKLCASWEKELSRTRKKGKQPSLLRATVKVFGWEIGLLGLILLSLEFCLRISQPIFIGKLISSYSGMKDINDAYIYAAAVILCSAINVLFMHPFMLGQLHLGMKLRVAMCSMIYRKALKLSKTALGDTTAGQVVNLLSNDVGRLDLSIIFFHYLWVGPLETIAVTYLMYREINIAAVFGVAFMLMFIPMQGFLGKKTSGLRLKTALRTDERVRLMNEIIQGIQVIKMYAWEIPFGKMVAYARKKEIRVIRYVSYIRGILLSFIMFVTRVSIFMSLIAYVLLGYIVTAEKAFVITAYYNILKQPMTVFFPQGISQLAETIVSIKRIQKYMLYDEIKISEKEKTGTQIIRNGNKSDEAPDSQKGEKSAETSVDSEIATNAMLSKAGIEISNLTAKWDPAGNENTLDEINLRVQPGTLVAIIGPVGAGKSSLIQAILGELPVDSGHIELNGTISYASQEPWLFTGTVRQNILFGQEMDRKRYKKVIKKCALERDFELLPYGDKTIVGERGASLSGGQKARISLARAVYRQSDIYLLDDPLSAVDTHVGRHLFDQCMKDYLNEKVVILVTHQLQFLQQADQIVILEHGKVSAVGTYESLRDSGLDFAQLLADPDKEDKTEELHRSLSGNRLHSRQNSEASVASIDDKAVEGMQVQESLEHGTIGLSLYRKYFRAGGGFCFVSIMIIFCILSQILASGGDYFLNYWVNKKEHPIEVMSAAQEATAPLKLDYFDLQDDDDNLTAEPTLFYEQNDMPVNSNATQLGIFEKIWQAIKEFGSGNESGPDDSLDVYIFTGITIATVIITLSRSFLFFNVAMKASRNLHDAMFRGVTRATMYFFNTNPSGRILNRFSKDMGQVDEILPSVMIDVIQIFLQLAGIVVVVAIVNPYLMIPTIMMGVVFYYLRDFYLKTSRNVKRMEAITRSPIYSHLSASLMGLSTIRAYEAQTVLIHEFDNHQNLHSSAFYMFISTSRAFGFWLDCFCVLYIAIVTLSFFVMGNEHGGNVGLAITQALGMTGSVQWGMRQSAELENTMTAVERVVEYNNIEPEGELEAPIDKKPPKDWPSEGRIEFNNLSLRYFPDKESDRVLKNLEVEIEPKEKVGIVGRTGAGKSSLINALFRLSYNEGHIYIDGIESEAIGLHDLRTKLSIIPQEPVLFSGSMRYNLDPFDEYSDSKLWTALEEVKLKDVVKELPSGLESKITEGGSNFSVGQRQLVCLARAILRENKVLVMDEATANVDPQTDALIQTTIRNKFKDCTVLTIAHRLNTVMDSDKVLVMDAGRVVEFGAPYELLTKSETKVFYGMVKQTGKATFNTLLKIAEQAYIAKEGQQ